MVSTPLINRYVTTRNNFAHRYAERFFRGEPARYMTKDKLTTALRRSFGDAVIKSDGAIGKLFDSFDFNRTDEMDWRAFLYMLSMLMQPYLFCDSLLR
jgi:Ca2+-binding EF-hand superfamily protein